MLLKGNVSIGKTRVFPIIEKISVKEIHSDYRDFSGIWISTKSPYGIHVSTWGASMQMMNLVKL